MIETFKTFEKFCLGRRKIPEIMDFSGDTFDTLMKLYNTGFAFPLMGRDVEGRRIILVRISRVDPNEFKLEDTIKLLLLICATLQEEEETQIAGFTFCQDLSNITLRHIFGPKFVLKVVSVMTNSLPMRFKEILLMNLPSFAKIIHDLFVSRIKEKMSLRFCFVDGLESLKIRIDEKLLPKEFGGATSCDEMKENFRKLMEERKEKVLQSLNANVDWSKVPEETNLNDDGVGSFRKLEID
jgi:hypothetical protein